MPGRLNFTGEDYLNLFMIYGECNKVISRTCDLFATIYPLKQKPTPNTVKKIIENFRNFASVKTTLAEKKPLLTIKILKSL